jgi:chorismate mutase/prephenate dehydratase
VGDAKDDERGREGELGSLREQIDAADAKIVELLNERARVVVEVGKRKRGSDTPIYAPAREQAVLARVLGANAGPLEDRCLEAIYRELMSGSFALEQPLRIGFLGPEGSFSHLAATSHFGSSVAFEDLREIAAVFNEVLRGHVDYGLVPIENSIGGGITETLDAFGAHRDKLQIYAELLLSVRHNLLANCEPGEIEEIHSKPEVFAQCGRWAKTHFPSARLVGAPSSASAAQFAAKAHLEGRPGVAAIGSRLAGERYGLKVLFPSIEDNPDNLTRFLVLAKQRALRSGSDKTTVMFRTGHAPGALVGVLTILAEAGLNLTHIDKRPSGRENWSYAFFVDLEGHRDDPAVAQGLERAAEHCEELFILGSYPRAQRVL